MAIAVRKLRPDDDRSTFDSGDPDLDRFFKRFAGQNQFKHYVGITYVAGEAGLLIGFATVLAAQVEIRDIPPATSGTDSPPWKWCRGISGTDPSHFRCFSRSGRFQQPPTNDLGNERGQSEAVPFCLTYDITAARRT